MFAVSELLCLSAILSSVIFKRRHACIIRYVHKHNFSAVYQPYSVLVKSHHSVFVKQVQ